MDLSNLTLSSLAALGGMAIVVGILVQLLKGTIPAQYRPAIPWLAIAIGIGLELVLALAQGKRTLGDLVLAGFVGFFAGAMATGFYQGTIDMAKSYGVLRPGLPPGPGSAPGPASDPTPPPAA